MNDPHPQLCISDEATFWPWLRWPQFAERKSVESTVVLVPIAGMADWGLDAPLDAEERVLLAVLRRASLSRPKDLPLLVVPPLRFVLGPEPQCAFPVDAPTAHRLIEEVVSSVAAAGFRKIVLFNASPWNEELCDAAARDLRIARQLQMFCIHLSALNLDFFPHRASSRHHLQAVLRELGTNSEPAFPALDEAVLRLVALLGEIRDRPPLPASGPV